MADNEDPRRQVNVPWRLVLPTLYPKGGIPLTEICVEYLGMQERQAKERAAAKTLPFPCFKLGGNKSPWMVRVDDFIAHLDAQADAAREAWDCRREAAA